MSWRSTTTDEKKKKENLMVSLDLLPETREQAKVKKEASKQLTAR